MERPFTLDRLDHVVLRVKDAERAVAFYTMLGGVLEGDVAAGRLVRINGVQSIILQERADYVPATLGSVDHINLMIHARDLDEVAAYLRENDVPFVGEPSISRAGPTVNVLDPDGYMVEIRMIKQ